jgi:putative membrane-bound dehydrogenase-like protein
MTRNIPSRYPLLIGLLSTLLSAPLLAAPPSDNSSIQNYRIAPGFHAEVAATEPMIINPVTMTWGPDGKLYVSEWYKGRGPNDQIKVLSDKNGDGVFDDVKVYMDHLDLPAGIAFWDGWTYISLDHDVVRMKDKDGDGKFETRQTIATGFGNDDSHHRVSGLIFGPDGWLYMTTGDSDAHAQGSDGSDATVLRCGGVFRCKPDGSRLENFAFGMRNPWGNVAFDDQFHMFHTDNDNEGSPGFTGCRILHVAQGGDYGWRLRQGARCCNPDFQRATWNGGKPGRLGWITETGRGAPAGLCVLNSAAFPPSTRNLLVYPDVFRRSVRAYEVEPKGGTFELHHEYELLGADDPLFRPDDAEIGPDGALYILDWRTDSGGAGKLSGDGEHGRIYRITWSGTIAEPARKTLDPKRITAVPTANIEVLGEWAADEDYGLRRAASLEIIRRGDQAFTERSATNQGFPAWMRAQNLAALSAVSVEQEVWQKLFSDLDPYIRRIAYDLAARSTTPIAMPTTEQDPRALRDYAIALGTMGQLQQTLKLKNTGVDPEEIASRLIALAAANTGADEFIRDGITRGLEKLGPVGITALQRSIKTGPPIFRTAAIHALEGFREPLGAAAIRSLMLTEGKLPPGARAGLLFAFREINLLNEPRRDLSNLTRRLVNWLRTVDKDTETDAQTQAIYLLHYDAQPKPSEAVAIFRPKLLDSPDTKVREAALSALSDISDESVGKLLVEVAANRDLPIEQRTLAVTGLRRQSYPAVTRELPNLFTTSDNPEFQRQLLRTIGELDHPYGVKLAQTLMNNPSGDLRNAAIRLLGERPETAEIVVQSFNDGKIPRGELPTVIDAVRHHDNNPSLQKALELLLKKFIIAAPTGEEAERLRKHVAERGSPENGKKVFLDSKKGGCANCHRIEGVGAAVGPDLTRIWQTLSFEKRVESILEPSKEIKEGYATTKIATKTGRVVTGLLVSQTDDAVTLKDAQGQEIRIPADDIEQKATDPTSLMPAGVVGNLSLNELADLLSFLGDQKTQESLRAK